MKRDIAERLAASTIDGLNAKDVHDLVEAVLAEIARCPVCSGTGTVTVAHGADFPTIEKGRERAGLQNTYIPAGTEMTCPACGRKDQEPLRSDPEYVGWRCVYGLTAKDCEGRKGGDDRSEAEQHTFCGFHVMLPLPKADQAHHG